MRLEVSEMDIVYLLCNIKVASARFSTISKKEKS